MNRWEEYQTHRAEIEEILERSRKHSMKRPTITRAECELLLGNNHSAVIYPRKKLVVVGGYNHYRLVE